jgi:electron transport complex protein RnfD
LEFVSDFEFRISNLFCPLPAVKEPSLPCFRRFINRCTLSIEMSEIVSTPVPDLLAAPPRRSTAREAPVWLMHSGMTASRFVAMHTMGAIFPVTAGILLFGWRAVGAILVVMFSSMVGLLMWRKVGSRGEQLRLDHCLWLAMLLAITLPAQLFSISDPNTGIAVWPILVAGGFFLIIFTWLLGGLGSGRVHPVLVTHLLLFVCFKDLLVPHYVLQKKHLLFGDIFHSMPVDGTITQPWIRATGTSPESLRIEPASQTLLRYTSGSERAWVSLDAMLRDRMPPLEDLIVGGHPAPIGMASAIAVIIGGLFLLYRGLIDYRVPLIIILSSILATLLLPVPVVIKENEVIWHWMVLRVQNIGWPVGVTLANYELMAGPLLFMAFFLATSPAIRPIARRARVGYAMIAGILTAIFQLYVSVSAGPYVALLLASVLTPTLDKIFRPQTLV